MGSQDSLPDAILELVLLRLDSPLWLLRAASTCKRWRRIIASDAFRAHHETPPVVAGSYCIQGLDIRPRFEPSPAVAAAIDASHFSLDFLPGDDDASSRWAIKDSRGSLLLLYREDWMIEHGDLIVCEPLTRRHEVIPPLTPPVTYSWYWSVATTAVVLLDGYGGGGGTIGMSNFRVVCVVQSPDRIRACMFTSGTSSWRETSIHHRRPVMHFIGVSGGRRYWHDGEKKVFALDQNALEVSSFVLPEDDDWRGALFTVRGKVTVTVGRDGEPRIVLVGGGNKLKMFARLQGSGGEEWALEKTIQLSAAMLGLQRLRCFDLTWHLPMDSGTVQIRVSVRAPGKDMRFRLDLDTNEALRLLGPDVDCLPWNSRTKYSTEFPWPPVVASSLHLRQPR